MIRATNTGVSAVIDATGKVVTQTPLFEQSVIVHQIPMLTSFSHYIQLGNWLVAACLLMIVWNLLQIIRLL